MKKENPRGHHTFATMDQIPKCQPNLLILQFGQPALHSAQVPGGSKGPNFQNNVREQAPHPFPTRLFDNKC